MSKVIMNAAFWREPAEEWRAVAHDIIDPEEKRLLHELVADYERLAERAAQREPNQSRCALMILSSDAAVGACGFDL
jgi:predicted kinase